MILQKANRASARNTSPILKTLICIIAILLLISSIYIFHTYYTTNSKINYEIKEIYVYSGLTAWDIAGEYKPIRMDPREYIYEIGQLNGINPGELKEGQWLVIPIYRGE